MRPLNPVGGVSLHAHVVFCGHYYIDIWTVCLEKVSNKDFVKSLIVHGFAIHEFPFPVLVNSN
jgi:hypothetical protein